VDGSQVAAAIAVAMTKLGHPYVWATAGPDTFDCSGFTWWIACQVLGPQDYELRSSHHQFNVWGEPVHGVPLAGDLVFFDVGQGVIMGNRAGHVAMMINRETFIHAANEDLGVRTDRLDADWYAPRFIGARRIFAPAAELPSDPHDMDREQPGACWVTMLPNISGNVSTRNPWNGRHFGVTWQAITDWATELSTAAAESSVDVRELAVVMMIETQGIHERDGDVLTIWDNHPEDGPSVGLMQVKPQVWGKLLPDADAYDPAGNIRLGAAVLRHLIDTYGSFEDAIARRYHPGVAPNGTTPASYVAAARGLLGELGYAA
jgi:hypothetical protein